MKKIEELKKIANFHWAVTKTRLSTCHFKNGVEKRLWVWLGNNKNPVLIKEEWVSGDNLEKYFSEWINTNLEYFK